MYKHGETVDVRKLYCNSIHHVADTYGIEAANRAIIKVRENRSIYHGLAVLICFVVHLKLKYIQ